VQRIPYRSPSLLGRRLSYSVVRLTYSAVISTCQRSQREASGVHEAREVHGNDLREHTIARVAVARGSWLPAVQSGASERGWTEGMLAPDE
jgi:hypothetical protein